MLFSVPNERRRTQVQAVIDGLPAELGHLLRVTTAGEAIPALVGTA